MNNKSEIHPLEADELIALWRDCGYASNDGNALKFGRAIEAKLATRCRAEGGVTCNEPTGAAQKDEAPGDALDAAIPPRVTPEMVAHQDSILDMLEKSRARMDALSEKYRIRDEESRDAECWRYIEEHATTHGGGHGFTITCFVPVDHEDMQCGILAAIATSTSKK